MLSNLKEIGKRIKEERENAGFKQQEFANKAKIESGSMSRYENGKQAPSLESIVQISQTLNVSLDYLIYGEKKKKIFTDSNDSNEYKFKEAVCYALATLVEADIVTNASISKAGDFCLHLQNDSVLLEFYNKISKLCDIVDSFSDDAYEETKMNLINAYKGIILEHIFYTKHLGDCSDEESYNEYLKRRKLFEEIQENYSKMKK